MANDEILDKVRRTLARVGLEDDAGKRPSEISGGMRKRAGLARAIIRDPAIVLYDEPTSGLDPVAASSIDLLIRRLQSKLGVTSLVVTHDMKSVYQVADRVAYLRNGAIFFLGTPEELRNSADLRIQDFIHGRSQPEAETTDDNPETRPKA
jgi:phospholipid/cholesterol/gamma-HCH transport system ATP-binding protein